MSWFIAFAGFAALIVLHEFGHFMAAKAVGMRVERFALFFPPLLFKVKRGETEYGVGAIPRLRALLPRLPADFPVYSGDDATTRAALLAGARGAISVTANVAPAAMAAMCEVAMAGDAPRAAELDAPLAGLHRTLFLETNPIPVKWAVHRLGLIGQTLRLPLTPLSESCRAPLEQAMQTAGVL